MAYRTQLDKDLGLSRNQGITEELWNSQPGVKARQAAAARAANAATAKRHNVADGRLIIDEEINKGVVAGKEAPNTFLTMGVPMAMLTLMPLAALAIARRRMQRRPLNVD